MTEFWIRMWTDVWKARVSCAKLFPERAEFWCRSAVIAQAEIVMLSALWAAEIRNRVRREG